ncbi:DUF3103 family protein [Microscilla marina]|uniref:Lipoprotein, putative n=1 Tax=Microscilla marina ATCC 23134 TaxID=313606 RepID=A1ZH21_MICM2|nr:DUF3103 family protein [Microscilla marina]EAY30290.1 lipoprotein, putative [Microscilla marina ATCC 23134]
MNILKLKAWVICLAFITVLASCQKQSEVAPEKNIPATSKSINKDKIALDVVDLLNQKSSRNSIINSLKAQQPSVALATILDQVKSEGINNTATQQLRQVVTSAEATYKNVEAPDNVEVPELWLHQPTAGVDFSKLLIAYAPTQKDEAEWTKVKAYNLQKEVVYLDPFKAPEVPVIVVETDGFEALKVEVAYMNKQLKKKGLQNFAQRTAAKKRTTASGLETTKLDRIRLNDDKEPWISGSAEVYAITSGIRGNQKEAQINVIPMYYLDTDGKTYYPNQVLLFWDDYDYQAANIQLFEKDDNHNYKDMVAVIVDGVFKITGLLTEVPIVSALGQIANAIIQAMPDAWFTNDDDYVDSFYTIEKNRTYRNYNGAGGNANVDLTPFFIPAN